MARRSLTHWRYDIHQCEREKYGIFQKSLSFRKVSQFIEKLWQHYNCQTCLCLLSFNFFLWKYKSIDHSRRFLRFLQRNRNSCRKDDVTKDLNKTALKLCAVLGGNLSITYENGWSQWRFRWTIGVGVFKHCFYSSRHYCCWIIR